MEKIARIYANKRDIVAVPGSAFATDGQKIYYVPIPDNTDPYILMKSKHGFLHEKDHCVFTDFTDLKAGKVQGSLHSIWNALEDTRIERLGSREWKGQLNLARDTLREMVKKEINCRFIDPSVSIFKKILDLIYLKVREHELGDLGLIVPDKVQRLFEEKVGDLLPAIYKADTQKAIIKIAKTLHKRMKDLNPPPPPQNQKGKPQKSDENDLNESQKGEQSDEQDNEQSDEQDNEQSDEQDNDQSQEHSSGDESEDQESGEDGEDEKDEGFGSGCDSSDSDVDAPGDDREEEDAASENQDSGDSYDGGDDSEPGDRSGSSDEDGDGEDSDNSGSVDDSDSEEDEDSESGDDSDSEEGGDAGSCDGSQDDLDEERKELAEEVDDNEETSSINDDIAKDVEEHADQNVIYRDANGLKEDIRRYNGNDYSVKCYEDTGRRMLGGNTSKFKRLFISMRAPKMTKMQRSGRLDLQRVWNDDSDVIFQRRQPGILEHSAVSMVIDNSFSMKGNKAMIASAVLAYMARELDRLRISFECMGFTTCGNANLDAHGVRNGSILINLIKEFNEPYRKIRNHFTWPSDWSSGTVEFPCIRYAAQRLIHREETKKVLFILSDGESGCPAPMMEAMIEYIKKLIQAGIIVVGIGIQNDAITRYVPDTIVIDNLDRMAPEIFNKLTRILLKEGR
jgi:cobalamin biosynthesis protein CobT